MSMPPEMRPEYKHSFDSFLKLDSVPMIERARKPRFQLRFGVFALGGFSNASAATLRGSGGLQLRRLRLLHGSGRFHARSGDSRARKRIRARTVAGVTSVDHAVPNAAPIRFSRVRLFPCPACPRFGAAVCLAL